MGVDLSSWAQGGTLSYQHHSCPAEAAGLESPSLGQGTKMWGVAPTLADTAVSSTWLSPQVWSICPSPPGDQPHGNWQLVSGWEVPSPGSACQAFLSTVPTSSPCPVLHAPSRSSQALPACAVGPRVTPVPGMPHEETPLVPEPLCGWALEAVPWDLVHLQQGGTNMRLGWEGGDRSGSLGWHVTRRLISKSMLFAPQCSEPHHGWLAAWAGRTPEQWALRAAPCALLLEYQPSRNRRPTHH